VKFVEPLMPAEVAVIVVEPAPAAVATPVLPIVATAVAKELHVAVLVTLSVEPSL
jgi:hypothetical protein